MTLPAYVLQLLTNATAPGLPVSWQAGSTPLHPPPAQTYWTLQRRFSYWQG